MKQMEMGLKRSSTDWHEADGRGLRTRKMEKCAAPISNGAVADTTFQTTRSMRRTAAGRVSRTHIGPLIGHYMPLARTPRLSPTKQMGSLWTARDMTQTDTTERHLHPVAFTNTLQRHTRRV